MEEGSLRMKPAYVYRTGLLLGAVLALSACGGSGTAGSSSGASTPPGTPAPAAIQGVSTPSNVSVVTATNAG